MREHQVSQQGQWNRDIRTLNALTELHQTRSPILRSLVAALLVVLAVAGGFAVMAHKTVTLTVDGVPMTVTTMKSRVIDVVTENGYTVGDRDDLFPAADEQVSNSEAIVLRRSKPLEISFDGQDTKQVWTTATTVDEALAQLAMTDTAPAAASRGSRLPLEGMALPVVSAKPVQINDGGVVRTVNLAAPDVGSLLAAAGAPLAQSDRVVPDASTPVTAGMQIEVTRIRIGSVDVARRAGQQLAPVSGEHAVGLVELLTAVEHLAELVGELEDLALPAQLGDGPLEPLLRVLEDERAGLAVGDIADRDRHEPLPVVGEGAQADVDRHLVPVAHREVQLERRPHRSGRRLLDVPLAQGRVVVPDPGGDQRLDRLAHQVAPGPAGEELALAVGRHHDAGAVDDQQGVRRRLHQLLMERSLGRRVAHGRDGTRRLRNHQGPPIPSEPL